MKIPKHTHNINIGESGQISFLDKDSKLIGSEFLSNLNCSPFYKQNNILQFDAISCDCGCHMLTLSVDEEDAKDNYVCMSSWHRPDHLPYSLKDKIKIAFKIFRGKIPFIDDFIFNKNQLLIIRALIDKYIKILENKNIKG